MSHAANKNWFCMGVSFSFNFFTSPLFNNWLCIKYVPLKKIHECTCIKSSWNNTILRQNTNGQKSNTYLEVVRKATIKPQLWRLGDLTRIPKFVKHLQLHQQAVSSAYATSENWSVSVYVLRPGCAYTPHRKTTNLCSINCAETKNRRS